MKLKCDRFYLLMMKDPYSPNGLKLMGKAAVFDIEHVTLLNYEGKKGTYNATLEFVEKMISECNLEVKEISK